MVSVICPSKINRLFCLFWIILIIVYITVLMIINIIIRVWSWKKIDCSIMGDALSWNLKLSHVVIVSSNESLILYTWSLNPVHLSATLHLD